MTTRTDAEHAYFAQVPNRLLADLRSAAGPVLTLIKADGRLHANPAATGALQQHRQHRVSAPVAVPPILFIPNRTALAPSSRERGAA